VGALGIPTALTAWGISREAGGLCAPLLGPWAGTALGHLDCTMGSQLPILSAAVALAGLAVAVGLAIGRTGLRKPLFVALGAWMFAWCALALMSVLNASI